MKQVHKWEHPANYAGASWEDWYGSGFGRSRDSDTLEESNFQTAWDALKKTAKELPDHEADKNGRDGQTVQIVCEGHWAVGWIEWIAIHESDEESLAIARKLCDRYEQYPVLNEEHWSNLEYERAMSYWDSCSLSEKVRLCQDYKVSVFAARRSYDLPDRLYEMLCQ